MNLNLLILETRREYCQKNGNIRAGMEEDRTPNAVCFLHHRPPSKCQQHHHNHEQSLVPGVGYTQMQSGKDQHDQAVREQFPVKWFNFAQE